MITIEDLKLRYGFSIPTQMETQYQAMLDTAISVCLGYIGTENGAIEEQFEGALSILYLTHHPITEINSVTVNGIDVGYTYKKRSSAIYLHTPATKGNSKIVVSYTVGWRELPADICSAIALTVQHLAKLQNSKQMGVLSRSTDGGTEQIEQSIPPLAVKGLLDRYRQAGL